jgi:hypothetical protein
MLGDVVDLVLEFITMSTPLMAVMDTLLAAGYHSEAFQPNQRQLDYVGIRSREFFVGGPLENFLSKMLCPLISPLTTNKMTRRLKEFPLVGWSDEELSQVTFLPVVNVLDEAVVNFLRSPKSMVQYLLIADLVPLVHFLFLFAFFAFLSVALYACLRNPFISIGSVFFRWALRANK